MKPQTPEEVAAAIVKLIEEPVAEIYTNPASPEIARRYYEDIGAFEARMARGEAMTDPAPSESVLLCFGSTGET